MDLLLRSATVYTGDGHTALEGADVLIRGGVVEAVGPGLVPGDVLVRDLTGRAVFPGVINHHAHACTTGPLFSSGSPAVAPEAARANADRQLREGVTTLVNVCGLGLPEDLLGDHPTEILLGTTHLPAAFRAADMVDGRGLESRHRKMTAERMLDSGAVLIGEVGSGATLGGGVSVYRLIPEAIEEACGLRPSAPEAELLKEAVLGHEMSSDHYREEAVSAVLEQIGLGGRMTPEQARALVVRLALEPVRVALEGFDQAAALSARTGAPAMFHTALPSAERLEALARSHPEARLIAGHANHPSFTLEECLSHARRLKDLDVVIDASTLDGIQTLWMNDPVRLEALVREGLLDTLTTDYGGGHWDGVLAGVQHLVSRGLCSPAAALALATGNVARAVGFSDRGFLRPGLRADLVVTDDKNLARVEMVVIAGRIVVEGGWLR